MKGGAGGPNIARSTSGVHSAPYQDDQSLRWRGSQHRQVRERVSEIDLQREERRTSSKHQLAARSTFPYRAAA